jgi:type II secretory pathway component GspD/PulD (secretin)
VLGGLRTNSNVKNITKVPLLGDLPGVKYAFRSVRSDKEDTELLVFITVHIVESAPLLADQKIKFDELANMPRKPTSTLDLVR